MERARRDAEDARDIARDELRRLPDYSSDDDESTARHTVPEIHVHLPSPSIHDSDPPAKKVRAGLIAVGSGIGVAILTGAAALLQNCGHH